MSENMTFPLNTYKAFRDISYPMSLNVQSNNKKGKFYTSTTVIVFNYHQLTGSIKVFNE